MLEKIFFASHSGSASAVIQKHSRPQKIIIRGDIRIFPDFTFNEIPRTNNAHWYKTVCK